MTFYLKLFSSRFRINRRFYSLKFEKSIIGYKQMPDLFYNMKRKKLPLKIFTAVAKFQNTFSDFMLINLMKYQYRYDLTFPSLINKIQISKFQEIKKNQMIPSEAIDEFGVELSVAHLVVHLGGAIRLSGSDEWIGYIKGSKNLLPNTRMKDFTIEAIDLSGTLITYEGLEYLPSLSKLKDLKLNSSSFLNDHCLRRIGRMRNKLQYLDISNCPQISGKGLAALWSLKNLKLINISNNPFLEDKELVCILLQEKIPLLQVQGVDYLAALNSKQKENILQISGKSEFEEIESNCQSDKDNCEHKENYRINDSMK